VLAESVRNWMDEPRNRELLDRLKAAGVRMEVPESERTRRGAEGALPDGRMSSPARCGDDREQAEAALKRLGAKVAGSVSRRHGRDCRAEAGSKAAKARNSAFRCWTKRHFWTSSVALPIRIDNSQQPPSNSQCRKTLVVGNWELGVEQL
jgi:NAD-dependent DNA ligase